MNGDPEFLRLDEVLNIHALSIQRHGGSDGVRDIGMVQSALGSAQNAFCYGGGDLFDIAAAYAFHLAEAQAFLDGNKRTAIASALVFLERHGIDTTAPANTLYDAMLAISSRRMDKTGLAALFRELFLASQ